MHTRRGLFFSKAHKTDCILCWFIFVHNNIATIYKSKNISATYAVHWSENTHIYAAKTQSVLLHPQMSFLCLILSRLFVESTYCSATTKTYPFRKNDAIAIIESIEVFVATCPRSVRTEQSRRFRRYLFLRFYSLIYSRSLQSRYLTWCFASNTLTDEQGRVYHSLFSLLSLMTFIQNPNPTTPLSANMTR